MAAHAHPDDEALFTGALLAHLHDAGVRTVVVTCTGGELGFGPDGSLPGVPGRDDDAVAAARSAELEASCALLGVDHLERMGYRDSGMANWPRHHEPDAFCQASVDEAASRLRGLLERYRPQVVVTYGPDGFYGHPDHVQTHRVVAAAVGTGVRVAYVAMRRARLADLANEAQRVGVDLPEWVSDALAVTGSDPGGPIDTEVDCTDGVERAYAAVRAHQSQLDLHPMTALGPGAFAAAFGVAALHRADAPRDAPLGDDLFAGLGG